MNTGGDGVEVAVDQLQSIISGLNSQARRILLLTLLNIFVVIASSSVAPFIRFSVRNNVFLSGLAFSAVALFVVLSELVSFDRNRRRGEIFYQEISEELQLEYRHQISEETYSRKLPLQTRMALRSFSAAARLPIAPSERTGPSLYALANVTLTLFAVMSTFLGTA